jgi:hypothetical protein
VHRKAKVDARRTCPWSASPSSRRFLGQRVAVSAGGQSHLKETLMSKKNARTTPEQGLQEPSSVNGTTKEALAYRLWLDRGCPGGSPEEDWFLSERAAAGRARPSSLWKSGHHSVNAIGLDSLNKAPGPEMVLQAHRRPGRGRPIACPRGRHQHSRKWRFECLLILQKSKGKRRGATGPGNPAIV